MDVLTASQRSFNMSRILRTNTKPEVLFRKYIWHAGIRGYRIDAKIKGRPDVLFPKSKLAVFIDGCFWHMCNKCYIPPKSNINFWEEKLKGNVERDRNIEKELRNDGYTVLRFWEHEIEKNPAICLRRLIPRLGI